MSDNEPEPLAGECSPERVTPTTTFQGRKSKMTFKKCKCDTCGKWFLHSGHLSRHLRDVHSSEKRRFDCDLCHKNFSRNDYLKLHKRNVHAFRTPVKHEQLLTMREKLLRILTNTETPPKGIKRTFACPQCHKICARNDRLKIHIKKKHGILTTDSEQPAPIDKMQHCCSQCGEKFSAAECLRYHMQIAHFDQHSQVSAKQHDVTEDQRCRTLDNSVGSGRNVRRCLDCGKIFISKDGYKAHMWSHVKHRFDSDKQKTDQPASQEKPLKIEVTSQEESKEMEQDRVKLLKCDECERTFAEYSEIRFHMLSHITNKSYKCSDCPKTFALISLLNRHRLIIHAPVKQHSCENCDERFATLQELEFHSQLHVSAEAGTPGKTEHVPGVVAGSVRAYTCHQCDKQFDELRSMNIHVTKAHLQKSKHECESCKQRFASAGDLARHSEIHKANMLHLCGVCGQVFKTTSQLKTHLNTHIPSLPEESQDSGPYKCRKCDKKFVHQGYYARHMQIGNCMKFIAPDRPGFQPHKCQLCAKSFNWSSNLFRHLKVAHSKDYKARGFVCPKCGKRFYQKDIFERHCAVGKCRLDARKGHRTGRFECPECTILFTFRTNLNRHMRRVHVNTDSERPHSCKDCHQGFKHVAELARHATEEHSEDSHNASKTSDVDVVKKKSRKTMKKPYSCPKCDKAFTTSGNLYRHLRKVHGGRKSECDKCCRVFPTVYGLVNHAKGGCCKAKDSSETSTAATVATQDQNVNIPLLENSETDECSDAMSPSVVVDPPSLVVPDSVEEKQNEES